MFSYLENIIEIDLSFFDASEITSMQGMFLDCKNLEKINFGNINTSSLESMYFLFYNCQKLTSIDLSNFDTSKVKDMELMFGLCKNLKYLDLSNFDTLNVNNIKSMFKECRALIYLNLNTFQLSDRTCIDNAFDFISSYVKICANDKKIKNILSQKGIYNDCSDICFKSNIKLDIVHNACIESCLDNGYKYELDNICYNECPEGSFPSSDKESDNNNFKNISKCYVKAPERYYLDINNKIYKKCYINCKYCHGEGNEAINNCIECNDNLTLINNSMYNTNCYEKCNYYYYFDETNNFHCTEICPNKYGKLIKEKNQCIDNCYKDDIYKYEYNDNCYINCPDGTYEFENNEEKICYETNPYGYYFDNDISYLKNVMKVVRNVILEEI